MKSNPLRWGILGTGRIARHFAAAIASSETGTLAAIGSRTSRQAQAFARNFPAPKVHATYESLLADPDVEAVYISTPHPMHAEWAIRSARAGKHILCEKPIAMNAAEAGAIAAAARESGVFLMEAFMYRCHPQTARLAELIRSGAIGEIRVIEATFSFEGSLDVESRLYNKSLGGGGILDVGCYTTSMARLVAGAACEMPFLDPISVSGAATFLEKTGVDLWAVAILKFRHGILAKLSCGIGASQPSCARIYGSRGWIEVPNPWSCGENGEPGGLRLCIAGQPCESIATPGGRGLYVYEIDAAAAAIRAGQRECEFMPVADTLGNMAALDQWRASIGLVYPWETARPPVLA